MPANVFFILLIKKRCENKNRQKGGFNFEMLTLKRFNIFVMKCRHQCVQSQKHHSLEVYTIPEALPLPDLYQPLKI